MSTISQFGGGGIKSIQRGVISLTGTSATATVTSVVTGKSELRLLGWNVQNGVSVLSDVFPSIVLTNSTTITATRSTNSSGNLTAVSWELTEFY